MHGLNEVVVREGEAEPTGSYVKQYRMSWVLAEVVRGEINIALSRETSLKIANTILDGERVAAMVKGQWLERYY